MNQFSKLCVLSALVGLASVHSSSFAAPAKDKASKAPQLVKKVLTISCKVTPKSGNASGVVVAQGGDQRGYALALKSGKPIFYIRQAGKLFTAKATSAPKGSFSLEGRLLKDGKMTLAVNGSVVASGKAPGLFAMQPKDGFSVGKDTQSPVGDYKAPNAFAGKVESVKVITQ